MRTNLDPASVTRKIANARTLPIFGAIGTAVVVACIHPSAWIPRPPPGPRHLHVTPVHPEPMHPHLVVVSPHLRVIAGQPGQNVHLKIRLHEDPLRWSEGGRSDVETILFWRQSIPAIAPHPPPAIRSFPSHERPPIQRSCHAQTRLRLRDVDAPRTTTRRTTRGTPATHDPTRRRHCESRHRIQRPGLWHK